MSIVFFKVLLYNSKGCMKKILNVRLQRNPLTLNPNEYDAHMVTIGYLGLQEIIDELIKEDKEIDKEQALKILNAFNHKTADLVSSGHNVNTNLVTLSPTVKGSFSSGKFNHELNSVDISNKCGYKLNNALTNNDLQISEVENADNKEVIEQSGQLLNSFDNNIKNEYKSEYSSSLLNPSREPACGMAFRRWLCNS